MEYGRPSESRRSPEVDRYSRDYRAGNNAPRARSQTRLDPEFIPTDYSPYGRPLEKSLRSKSLDYRDALKSDDYGSRRGPVNIPIRQETRERHYDYGKDAFPPTFQDRERLDNRDRLDDSRYIREREIDIPIERGPRHLSRSTDWLDRRYDERDRRPRMDRQSPRSISSNRNVNLNQSYDVNRGRAIEYRYGDDGGYAREEYRDRRPDWREAEKREPVRGASHGRHANYNYHYESGHGEVGSPPRRVITQQPHGLSPPTYGAPSGPMTSAKTVHNQTPRPQQYHRIRCCCFNLTWPPWSYETTAPPQPIYKNI